MRTGFTRQNNGTFIYYTADNIKTPHMFTTRYGGVSTGYLSSMNLGFHRGDTRENVRKNYEIVAETMGVPVESITATKQVHGDQVTVVRPEHRGMGVSRPFLWETDALVTEQRGIVLAGFYADCVVTLLYDERTEAVGVCHSGWRGTAENILGKTVARMAEAFGSRPEDIRAAIGPSIGPCCFETDEDVPAAMKQKLGGWCETFIRRKGTKYSVDLQGLNAEHLRRAGVREIADSGMCTCCRSDEFWSHRKTRGKRGVLGAFIGLSKE